MTRSTVTAAGLLAGVFAIVYSYRKQKIEEANSHRADVDSLGTRYQEAAEKLGNESAPVRLAGIYSLSRLADEDSMQRETICKLLCGYLRIPYDPSNPSPGEREVRHTVIKVIADHLQDPDSDTTWCSYDLDFSGAVFDGGTFNGAHFINSSVDFSGCLFKGGTTLFHRTTFQDVEVDFGDGDSAPAIFDDGQAQFIGANFKLGAYLTFIFAKFKAGSSLEFGGATFLPGAILSFSACELKGGFLGFGGPVWMGAKFHGGDVHLAGADLESGVLSFMGAEFRGSHVDLNDINMTGAAIYFDDATFESGSVTFKDAKFTSGEVSFGLDSNPESLVSPWPLPIPRRRKRVGRRLYGWRPHIIGSRGREGRPRFII
ncbi:pentapeptide repeat-containing protein [Streptomyces mirabilis]|uniref:pentapeptide repeat-containing protein n=1 Tax=Streptomyces mirabilis TaxID=68239 RepID=UPI0033A41146